MVPLQLKLFLSEEGYREGGNAFLAEAEKQSGELQTKECAEGHGEEKEERRLEQGEKGKEGKPKTAWKDEKIAKGIGQQMWAVQSLSRQGKVLRPLQRSTDYCGLLYLSKPSVSSNRDWM